MDTANWIFLSPSQTLDAFACDFQQYGPQPDLFARLVNGFPGMECGYCVHGGRPVFQVARKGKEPDLEISPEKMGFFLIHLFESVSLSLQTLETMAGMVFQTPSVCGDFQGEAGIWVAHGMDGFSCVQCGRCCRELSYASGVTREDVAVWQRAGRTDILARVRQTEDNEFEIWIDPDTGRFYDSCPWLALNPDTGRWFCSIHDHKPEICRQYPLTAKHAAMTGCRGRFSASPP